MSERPVVALLTDFGTRDPYVGVMHCVIVDRCPAARIVDLTHGVTPGSVAEGAFWLRRVAAFVPAGAVVVGVVDRGVGSERRGLVVAGQRHTLVGPDNGLLAGLAADEGAPCHAVDLAKVGLAPPSATFHGRDVFAPIAAEIAAGRLAPREVGPRVDAPVPCPLPAPRLVHGGLDGEIVTVDRFGNLVTNVEGSSLEALRDVSVRLGPRAVPLRRTYADVAAGRPLALVGSFGTLEIAVRDGSARDLFGAGPGVRVQVRGA